MLWEQRMVCSHLQFCSMLHGEVPGLSVLASAKLLSPDQTFPD